MRHISVSISDTEIRRVFRVYIKTVIGPSRGGQARAPASGSPRAEPGAPTSSPFDFAALRFEKGDSRNPMGLLFEWDTKKARQNIRIHGISFDEASTAFRDPLSRTIADPLHSEKEERLVLIG